jgi:group I intron endonuclease
MKLTERKACKNKVGIYKITNEISGLSYIGQASNIASRIYQHLHSSVSENMSDYNYPLHKAFRKYGSDNFSFEVLEECDRDLLNEREMYWITFYDTFKNGYNQTAGGYQSIRQIKLSESEVDQIRNRLMTTTDSMKDIAKDFGVKPEMIGAINNGKCWNNSEFSYPLRNSDAVRLKNVLNTGLGVYQLDKKTGEVINIFISATQAALHLGSEEHCAHIGKCLAGKRKTAYGYKWETRPITEAQFKELVNKAILPDEVKQLV